MSTSIFDPASLLDVEMDAPLEERPPIPVGDYTAVIGEIAQAKWASKDGLKSGIKWNVPLALQIPPDVQAELGLDNFPELKLTDSIMLDTLPNGSLDNGRGKNGRLRMYREALDMNKPGDSFSARKMVGQAVLVHIDHREYEGRILENPTRVARLV